MKEIMFNLVVIGFMIVTINQFNIISKDYKSQIAIESLDYKVLKDHTDKLAKECLELRYQIEVLAERGVK